MRLYIVIPCYNEEEVIKESARILKSVMDELITDKRIDSCSRVLFADDGSADGTWEMICCIHNQDSLFEGIRLSKNKGHQTAVFAGTEAALKYADVIITMDADLQQDVRAIPRFLDMYEQGYQIVCGIRNDRNTDSVFKRTTASLYYWLLHSMGCDVIENSADYRMLSWKAADALVQHKESNLFIRGLVPTLGFKSGTLYFDVKERSAGESKYTLKKMVQLALDGITSFSIRPIRIILCFGIIVFMLSIFMIAYIVSAYISSSTVSGWASLAASVWFLGGGQLIGTGIVGEYIGRIYMESKRRPRYFIEDSRISSHEKQDEDANAGGGGR